MRAYVSMAEVEKVWLDAMGSGYISDREPEQVPQYQNFTKRFVHEIRGFKVVDEWTSVSGEDFSFGRTMVWRDGFPLWVMQYYGYYKERAIPFLKEALTENYVRRRVFLAGRGPDFYQSRELDLNYSNAVHQGSTFTAFTALESIQDRSNGEHLGHHRIMGGRMCPE